MGRVFTPTELAKRQWPHPSEFTRILSTTDGALKEARSIVATLIFGSLCYEGDDLRSDIDWLVIYHDKKAHEARELLTTLAQAAREAYVPLDLLILSKRQAEKGVHSIGPLFLGHLAKVEKSGGHKGQPLQLIKPTGITAYHETQLYLGHKLASLEKQSVNLNWEDEKALVTLLQKALEAPIQVARKVMSTLTGVELGGKKEVLSEYSARFGDQTNHALRELVNADRHYDNELKVLRRDYSDEKYRQLLRELLDEVPRVLDFLQLNAKILAG